MRPVYHSSIQKSTTISQNNKAVFSRPFLVNENTVHWLCSPPNIDRIVEFHGVLNLPTVLHPTIHYYTLKYLTVVSSCNLLTILHPVTHFSSPFVFNKTIVR